MCPGRPATSTQWLGTEFRSVHLRYPYTSQELCSCTWECVWKSSVHTCSSYHHRHAQPCPRHTERPLNNCWASSYKGHLPPPGGLPHCHPCRSLQRGWETLRHSIWTCTPPEGQRQAPTAQCQTPGRHCQAPLHLCNETEHGVKPQAEPGWDHPPMLPSTVSSCHMQGGHSFPASDPSQRHEVSLKEDDQNFLKGIK